MTWLDKLKSARKTFRELLADPDRPGEYHEEDKKLLDAFVHMTEAIEEVARHAKVPLTDWDKPQP